MKCDFPEANEITVSAPAVFFCAGWKGLFFLCLAMVNRAVKHPSKFTRMSTIEPALAENVAESQAVVLGEIAATRKRKAVYSNSVVDCLST